MSAALDSLNTSWMAAEPLSVITVAVAAATDGRVQRLARLLDRKGMLVTRTFAGFDEPVAELPQAEQDCRRRAEVPQQQASRPLAGEHDKGHRQDDRERYVRPRGTDVRARALVDA